MGNPSQPEADRPQPGTWITWDAWKADALNRLFHEQGRTGKPGQITAETVRDGRKKREVPA